MSISASLRKVIAPFRRNATCHFAQFSLRSAGASRAGERVLAYSSLAVNELQEKVRFGATPKPARETRALPGGLRHFSRIGRSHFRGRDKPDTNRDQEERKELAARERSYQGRIGFAEIFDYDTKHRVQN